MKKFYNSPEMELKFINSFDCITVSDGRATEGVNDQEVGVGDL